MNDSERYIWANGTLLPADAPVYVAESRGVMYGAGCFETLRSRNGGFLHIERHLERLAGGLDWLGVPAAHHPGQDDIKLPLLKLLDKNRLLQSEALVRLQASVRGKRGYDRDEGDGFDLVMTADSLRNHRKPCRLVPVETRVVPSVCRPAGLKLSNSLHYMQAWRRARARGYDDALMLTVDGVLAETAIANLFWKKGKVVYTPSGECDILPGLTRRLVIELLDEHTGCMVEQGRYNPEALYQADLVWITNSLRQIHPVSQIGELSYPGEDPFYDLLIRDFESYKKENLS